MLFRSTESITATLPAHEVAKIFERHDLVTAPVVDEDGMLVGRITIDDVVDVIREEADHSLMSMAGLDEDEDTFGSVWQTARRRALWLGINLLTALAASAVIGLFEATLEKVVALAILMPIVASMGGIAGSQTLTLVIRAMALGQIQSNNTRYLLFKELSVGDQWPAMGNRDRHYRRAVVQRPQPRTGHRRRHGDQPGDGRQRRCSATYHHETSRHRSGPGRVRGADHHYRYCRLLCLPRPGHGAVCTPPHLSRDGDNLQHAAAAARHKKGSSRN